ncbi:TraR/DksA family transcriptional regulator (plasmid) [Serratia sp. JSRIV001]|uniref:TraR/DksA family transcriptional regulator n=1 Tax=unclassified Serratia (in: enterobacteria) TaxID=2647522 RepID=UPI001CBCA33F|nr:MULTISPECIES: TraR/DksA family transcriptional regulator [unclassified Serratia (in: enterobacteria)]UAN45171.1 TraR/DksA family transcriptional regulator [Serratia sp. JSRIV001]UAN48807.1 TraR/DksA family transcriptional regulator [Serratia sp. JSRIV001]UAN50678.1 TraR/DksA family transcriptional regulator [Serratia sp. JSRIV002]UAN54561.1 TraR/DksA family transcriptional regulator [Serratia sp. JSRIV002]UAN56635.1 TraR/DksA family transcriptional regulator [Serratia sp. JSRIV004]
MADIADEAQNEHEKMIERGLMAIRSQFTASSALVCQDCGEPIPERRRHLLPGVKTCVLCQERKEFQHKVGVYPLLTRHAVNQDEE